MLCQLLVYSKVIQLYIHMYLFFFKFFSYLGYYRILSSISCAIYTVGPCWLSILFYFIFNIATFLKILFYLFYFLLHWVFVAERRL